MFLGWYDDTPKKSVPQKLQEAVERYVAKFGEAPSICLLNAADDTKFDGLEIKVVEYVRPNYYWVGKDESLSQALHAA